MEDTKRLKDGDVVSLVSILVEQPWYRDYSEIDYLRNCVLLPAHLRGLEDDLRSHSYERCDQSLDDAVPVDAQSEINDPLTEACKSSSFLCVCRVGNGRHVGLNSIARMSFACQALLQLGVYVRFPHFTRMANPKDRACRQVDDARAA